MRLVACRPSWRDSSRPSSRPPSRLRLRSSLRRPLARGHRPRDLSAGQAPKGIGQPFRSGKCCPVLLAALAADVGASRSSLPRQGIWEASAAALLWLLSSSLLSSSVKRQEALTGVGYSPPHPLGSSQLLAGGSGR